MKRENKVSRWMVAPHEHQGLYDMDGFIRKVSPVVFFFAVSCISYGLLSLCNTYILRNDILSIVVPVGFLICIMFYIAAIRSLKRDYIH